MEKDSGSIFMGEKRKQKRSQRCAFSNRQMPPRYKVSGAQLTGLGGSPAPWSHDQLLNITQPESSTCPELFPSMKFCIMRAGHAAGEKTKTLKERVTLLER